MRALACLLLIACGDADPTPRVEIVSSSPTTLAPDNDLADDLTLLVRYQDGDADLGEGVAEIVDCRAAGVVSILLLPAIASQQAIDDGVAIRGELSLVVTDVGRIAPDDVLPPLCVEAGVAQTASDEAVFCVVLVDRAGHRSAPACSPPIRLE